MDSADFITLMLMDKSYYDYDYQEPKRKSKGQVVKRSSEEVSQTLARFGFKTKLHQANKQPLTPEEIQQAVMEDIRNRQ